MKTIYTLSKNGAVHGASIAEKLGVSRPTVSVYLKNLQAEGYICMDENRAVWLTEKGAPIAEEIYERHVTLRRFLEKLGVDRETAAQDACQMEHAISAQSFEALKKRIMQNELEQSQDLG